MKRFLIPAMLFLDASSANEADLDGSDLLIAFNQSRTDNTRIHMCQFSDTVELEDGIQPEDLSEHPARGVKTRLEEFEKQIADLTSQLAARTTQVRELHDALANLSEECDTNAYFGDGTGDDASREREALDTASETLARISRPD